MRLVEFMSVFLTHQVGLKGIDHPKRISVPPLTATQLTLQKDHKEIVKLIHTN